MNPASIDLKKIIVDKKIIGINDDFLFIGHEPATPANCISIFDTGGPEQDPKLAIDEIGVQIRSRNKDYLRGSSLLSEIKKTLEGKSEITLNDTKYIGFWVTSNIAFIQYDKNYRAIWTMNFRIIREPIKTADKGNRE